MHKDENEQEDENEGAQRGKGGLPRAPERFRGAEEGGGVAHALVVEGEEGKRVRQDEEDRGDASGGDGATG